MGASAKPSMTFKQRMVAIYHARVTRPAQRISDFWSDHPMTDMALIALLVVSHATCVFVFNFGDVFSWADASQRTDTYAAGAGITALIAGFTGTAIAQYGSSSGPLISAIRAAYGSRIRKNWLSITKWLMVAAALCVISMAIDGGARPKGSSWVFEVAFAIAILKFTRLIFLFDLILISIDRQDKALSSVLPSAMRPQAQSKRRVRVPHDPGVEFDEED
ncbi:hypothetical protein [Micromonospora haikouensis]|uniref:hypothetical protein n=1 Tax=Micromonospora haikouensis TaxID=686309 RepID=UPI0033DA7839